MQTKQLLGIKVSLGSYAEFVDALIKQASSNRGHYTCVANVHMLIEAYKDPSYATIVNNADIVTPDGKPLCWALKLLFGIKQSRVAGMDLLPDLLTVAELYQLPIFFYGGTDSMLKTTKTHLSKKYPKLILAGMISPPFRPLTESEELAIVNTINDSNAKLIIVALGCPKQEKWMSAMKEKIKMTMIGIGGALPVLVGMQKRAPRWMQNVSLEWLFRLIQEPRRLFKRYAITNSFFIFLLIKEKFSFKKNNPN